MGYCCLTSSGIHGEAGVRRMKVSRDPLFPPPTSHSPPPRLRPHGPTVPPGAASR